MIYKKIDRLFKKFQQWLKNALQVDEQNTKTIADQKFHYELYDHWFNDRRFF